MMILKDDLRLLVYYVRVVRRLDVIEGSLRDYHITYKGIHCEVFRIDGKNKKSR